MTSNVLMIPDIKSCYIYRDEFSLRINNRTFLFLFLNTPFCISTVFENNTRKTVNSSKFLQTGFLSIPNTFETKKRRIKLIRIISATNFNSFVLVRGTTSRKLMIFKLNQRIACFVLWTADWFVSRKQCQLIPTVRFSTNDSILDNGSVRLSGKRGVNLVFVFNYIYSIELSCAIRWSNLVRWTFLRRKHVGWKCLLMPKSNLDQPGKCFLVKEKEV